MRDRNSCQILQYLQKWITECSLRIADSSRQMMIFGHLVWGLIQVLRGRAPNDVICHQTMAIQEQPHGKHCSGTCRLNCQRSRDTATGGLEQKGEHNCGWSHGRSANKSRYEPS